MSNMENTESDLSELTIEQTAAIYAEVWPFLDDIALKIDAASSVLNVIVESPLYVPIARERLRRLGYEATSSEASASLIKVGHVIAHSLTIEVRPAK